jgi:hypothetical protein
MANSTYVGPPQIVATTAKTVTRKYQCNEKERITHTDETLNVTDEPHGVVENKGNDAGVDEDEEDEDEKLPSAPAMAPCEWKLGEVFRMLLVVFL